jgi:hypothetical protein
MSNGRFENRIAKTVRVEVSLVDDPTLKEKTWTENVSAHGARIVVHRELQPKQEALVSSPNDGVRSRARVVYCERVAENKFAVGLALSAGAEPWVKAS